MRLAAAVAVGLWLLVPAATAQETDRLADVVEIKGVIDPPVADYISSRIDAAEDDGVHVLILQIDTPGALDVSVRSIVADILDARVPVIAWIAPRGARAASAGTFITYAANRAYMAEATELGPALPPDLGRDTDSLDEGAIDDAAAFIVDLAELRGRNAGFAEAAVRDEASIGSAEAADIGVVDGIASSLRALLEAVDGDSIEVGGGQTVTLETWNPALGVDGAPTVTIRFQQMNLLQRLLHAVMSPEIAFFLLLAGMFGLIFELYNPGIGLAGILGAGALALAFYSLSILPTNWAGVLLIVVGIVFLVVDLQAAGLGIWTVGGIAALVVGGLVIFSGAEPALRLSPWVIVVAVIGTLIFFISVMTAALRVRLRRPITGEGAIVGMVGEAKTDIAPEGTVLTKGTLWRARTMETGIAAGSKVQVKATEGLVLLVEPLHESEPEPAEPPS